MNRACSTYLLRVLASISALLPFTFSASAETLGGLAVDRRGGAVIQSGAVSGSNVLLLDGAEGTYATVKPDAA